MSKFPQILLVGHGKMGSAMRAGWWKAGIPPSNIRIVDPDFGEIVSHLVKVYEEPDEIGKGWKPDVVVFAIKPQVAGKLMPTYAKYKNAVFLSIMAGQSIKTMKKALGKSAKIVRAMPNLPASIGKGITVAVASNGVSKNQKAACHKLLSAIGKVEWVKDEGLMDTVTAVSGSGPAYLFYFMEVFIQAAEKSGLKRELAEALVKQTLKGSFSMTRNKKLKDIQELRENVTSPGGTTAAALKVLMNPKAGLLQLLTRAVKDAKTRSKQLSS